MSRKRIKEMARRAREKKVANLVKKYHQSSALVQVAALRWPRSLDVTPAEGVTRHPVAPTTCKAIRDTLFSALALGKTSPVVDVEVVQPHDQTITAQVFLRNDDDSLEVVEQMIHAELAERMIWQGDDAIDIEAPPLNPRIEAIEAHGSARIVATLPDGETVLLSMPRDLDTSQAQGVSIGGRVRANKAVFATTALSDAMNDPENDEGRDRLHALIREQARRLRFGLTTVNEVAELLGIEVPSFADMNDAPHEDLVRALATGNDSRLSEEFISQRLSVPLPVSGIVEQGPSYEPQVFTSLSDAMGAFEGGSLQDILSTLRYVAPKEARKTFPVGFIHGTLHGPAETYIHRVRARNFKVSTEQEQIEVLLESPDVPDCVRWNFIAWVLEESFLRDWVELDIEPRSDFLESIQAIKQLANDKITFRELRERRGRLRIVLPYDSPCSAKHVSHSYRYKVPYERQLAHLRSLIAEHNKHRLPLLLCLKERAQRIKQAPSYGQQLEEVLYT